jgi:hypothetical protein
MGYGYGQKEAAETTIRVPHSLKDELNNDLNELHGGTPHGTVRKLIDYYRRTKRQENDARAYQEQHMLDVGEDCKAEFVKLKEDLNLRTDAGVLEFLVYCYHANLQMPMGAFDTYRKLKKEGK